MRFKQLIIANTAEAFLSLLGKYGRESREQKLLEEHQLSERSCFWGGDGKIVVTSFPVPEINSRMQRLGYKEVVNLFPEAPSESLSRDVRDALSSNLVSLLGRDQLVDMISYVASDELLGLIAHLQGCGVNLRTTEAPNQSALKVAREFDTKSGFRRLCSEWQRGSAAIRMPFGMIFDSPVHAARFALGRLAEGRPCICKADRGESGIGLIWLYPGESHTESSIIEAIRKEPAFEGDEIVVEDVVIRPKIPGFDWSSPSVEVYVDPKGIPNVTYVCSQRVNAEGEFSGILIDSVIIPAHVFEVITEVALSIGDSFANLGYRGYFDLDFVLDKDFNLFLLEGNPRRTGGTHVHDLACHLLGQDYGRGHSILSSDCSTIGSFHCEEVLDRVADLLFSSFSKPRGLIPTVLGRVQDGFLGYVIIGDSLPDAIQQEERLLSRLRLSR